MNDVKRKQANNINDTARPSKLRLRRSLSNEGKNIFNNIVHQANNQTEKYSQIFRISRFLPSLSFIINQVKL